jgi:hypothetical protein
MIMETCEGCKGRCVSIHVRDIQAFNQDKNKQKHINSPYILNKAGVRSKWLEGVNSLFKFSTSFTKQQS